MYPLRRGLCTHAWKVSVFAIGAVTAQLSEDIIVKSVGTNDRRTESNRITIAMSTLITKVEWKGEG